MTDRVAYKLARERFKLQARGPDVCPDGHRGSRIVGSERHAGYRRRRHACLVCTKRWSTYETTIHPACLIPKTPH